MAVKETRSPLKQKKILYSAMIAAFAAILTIMYNTNIFSEPNTSGKDAGQKFYVHADGGLRMRVEPNTNAAIILLIPYGDEVSSIEETKKEETIGGKNDTWHKVIYEGKTGWVFGGFLAPFKPVKECVSFNNFPMKFYNTFNNQDGKAGDEIILYSDHTGKFSSNIREGGRAVNRIYSNASLTWKLAGGQLIVETSTDIFKKIDKPFNASCQNQESAKFDKEYKEFRTGEKVSEKACVEVEDLYGHDSTTFHLTWTISISKTGVVYVYMNGFDSGAVSGFQSAPFSPEGISTYNIAKTFDCEN